MDLDIINELPDELVDIFNGQVGQFGCIHNGVKYFIFRNTQYLILCSWSIDVRIKHDWETKLINWIQNNKLIQLSDINGNIIMNNSNFIFQPYSKKHDLLGYNLYENSLADIISDCDKHSSFGLLILNTNYEILYFNNYIKNYISFVMNKNICNFIDSEGIKRVLNSCHNSWLFIKNGNNLFNTNVVFKDKLIYVYMYLTQENTSLKNNRLSIVGEMSISIYHDINNIVAIIFILIEDLLEKNEDDVSLLKCRKFLFRIKNLTNRLLSLMVDNKKSNKSSGFVSVIPVLEEWIRSLNQINSYLTIRLFNHVGEIHASIDEFYFGQIIFNLIKNAIDAIKHMNDGLITIDCDRVKIENSVVNNDYFIASGDYVKININNNGESISNKKIDEIFNNDNVSSKSEGHGLGLGIIFDVIKKHNGLIKINNNTGTNFVIYLPEYRFDKKTNVAVSSLRILLVEDEQITRNAIKNWLQLSNHIVKETDDLQNAENILQKEEIDLIVIDLHIKNKNSEYLIQMFMNEKKIIIISGYCGNKIIHDNIKYISKPFDKTLLRKTIEDIYSIKSNNK